MAVVKSIKIVTEEISNVKDCKINMLSEKSTLTNKKSHAIILNIKLKKEGNKMKTNIFLNQLHHHRRSL